MTTHVSCRLPASLGEQLDSAAAENNAFRSELVRRAIRYYIRENPDGFDVLTRRPRKSTTRPRTEPPTDTGQSRDYSTYDPLEDLF